MAAGYNERKSYANVTVDWMAYQGAPVGGVTGDRFQYASAVICRSGAAVHLLPINSQTMSR